MRWSLVVAAAACGNVTPKPAVDAALDCSRPAGHGVLDPCFGEHGVTLTEAGAQQRVVSLLVTPDDHVVAVGLIGIASTPQLAVARYTPDGHIDPSFGGGLVIAQLPNSTATTYAYGAALAPDGSVLVAGTAGAQSELAIVRFTAAGALDATFGTGGVALAGAANGYATGVEVLADGRVLAAGGAMPATVEIARLTSGGVLDPTFGTAGVFSDALAAPLFFPEAVAFASDGGVALAGQVQTTAGADVDPGVAHYTSSFTHATAFLDAVTAFDLGESDEALIAAVGTSAAGGFVYAGSHLYTPASMANASEVFAVAIGPTGALDGSYANGGIFHSTFGEAFAAAQAGVIAADGSLVLVGRFANAMASGASLYRLDAHGAPDSTFGSGGELEIVFPDATNDAGEATAIAIDSQGRYVVAGDVGSSWFVSRYWP
ncbi:MAG TPA: hypothetical protein VMJ10_23705 [Kofleriaceae bacterium]|nr:hypothetical protein [Kofleriaceae bacterium]